MERICIAPGAYVTELPGDKFKRCKLAVHLVTPSVRESATALALLPHVLDRRCEAVPDTMQLSRLLYTLYGAELSSESYTAGPSRVVTLSIAGLKNGFALAGEDLEGRYVDLLCNLLFAPKLSDGGVLDAGDVAIELEKQAEYLRSEMNDKRGYCIRQGRRRLYRDNPLGIESSGYLEDIAAITAENLYEQYRALLCGAQVEVLVCGLNAAKVGRRLAEALSKIRRSPLPPPFVPPLPAPSAFRRYSEAMDTVQGKLCILATGGAAPSAKYDAVMRVASALYGGLPTSRLFMNVREKEGLCYYCAAVFGFFAGTLCMDSGVDHDKADAASAAILRELKALQTAPVSAEELQAALLYLRSSFASAKDSPDALLTWAFNERLRGTWRSLDEMDAQLAAVTANEVREVLAAFSPAVEYRITGKGGAGDEQL